MSRHHNREEDDKPQMGMKEWLNLPVVVGLERAVALIDITITAWMTISYVFISANLGTALTSFGYLGCFNLGCGLLLTCRNNHVQKYVLHSSHTANRVAANWLMMAGAALIAIHGSVELAHGYAGQLTSNIFSDLTAGTAAWCAIIILAGDNYLQFLEFIPEDWLWYAKMALVGVVVLFGSIHAHIAFVVMVLPFLLYEVWLWCRPYLYSPQGSGTITSVTCLFGRTLNVTFVADIKDLREGQFCEIIIPSLDRWKGKSVYVWQNGASQQSDLQIFRFSIPICDPWTQKLYSLSQTALPTEKPVKLTFDGPFGNERVLSLADNYTSVVIFCNDHGSVAAQLCFNDLLNVSHGNNDRYNVSLHWIEMESTSIMNAEYLNKNTNQKELAYMHFQPQLLTRNITDPSFTTNYYVTNLALLNAAVVSSKQVDPNQPRICAPVPESAKIYLDTVDVGELLRTSLAEHITEGKERTAVVVCGDQQFYEQVLRKVREQYYTSVSVDEFWQA